MPNTDATVSRYIEMWNETDSARRRELVAQVVSEHASYLDPLMKGEGEDGRMRSTTGFLEPAA